MENNLQYKGKYIYNWFSNFEPITIIIDNVKYPSVENYYQSQKTLDLEERKQFQNCSPSKSKFLGKKVKLRKDWDNIKNSIMKKIKILDVEYFYVIEKHYCEHGDCYETKFYSTSETELKPLNKFKKFFGINNDLEKQPKYLFSCFLNIESVGLSKERLREILEQEFNKYLAKQKRIMEIEKGELI